MFSLRFGSVPATTNWPPTGTPRRASTTSRCPPWSRPSPSRSIVGSGDRPLLVVEAVVVHGLLERSVATEPAGPPLLEAFQIEQRTNLGIPVVHGQEQLA